MTRHVYLLSLPDCSLPSLLHLEHSTASRNSPYSQGKRGTLKLKRNWLHGKFTSNSLNKINNTQLCQKIFLENAKYYKNIKIGNMIHSAWAGSIKYSGSEDSKLDSRVKIIQKPQAFKGHKFFAFLTISIAANF